MLSGSNSADGSYAAPCVSSLKTQDATGRIQLHTHIVDVCYTLYTQAWSTAAVAGA